MAEGAPSLFDLFALLLVLAATIACLNQLYWRMPRGIAILAGSLVFSAVVTGLRHLVPGHHANWAAGLVARADLPHLFLDGALAFLLFAGTLGVDLADLRRNVPAIALLSSLSVIVATVVFGLGMWGASLLLGAGVPLGWWLVLGAALAPTDAVVVTSLLGRAPIPSRLRALISGESLFNDGAGLVMFLIAIGIAGGGSHLVGHGRVMLALGRAALGGAAIGCAGGWLAGLVLRRVGDDAARLLVTLALVLCSYRFATLLDVSGPIAVVSAGLLLGRMLPALSETGGAGLLQGFWTMLNELLDSLLFLVLGLETLSLEPGRLALLLAALSLPVALLSRLVSVALPVCLAQRPPRPDPRGMALLTWSGLRGGVSVALALTMPPSPYQPLLLFVCYGVVLASILGQGMTVRPLALLLFGTAAPKAD